MLKYKVYVIDDDKFIADGLKYSLTDFETAFEVTTFTDPTAGLQATIASPPDLVFLDLMMPYIKGEEILSQLKKRKIPTRVVVVTVIKDVAKIVEMIKAGACDYITKPFSPEEVIKTAKRVVVLEETLDKVVEENVKLSGRDLNREMIYSLFLNIVDHFSYNELSDLCFRIDIDFESLAGNQKEHKTRELVQYCKRQNRIVELAKVCNTLRPHVEIFNKILKFI